MLEVLGIEKVDYTSKTNQKIQGVRLHLGYQRENCVGYCVKSEYIGNGVNINNVKIGDFVELLYNEFRKVARVDILPSEKINF